MIISLTLLERSIILKYEIDFLHFSYIINGQTALKSKINYEVRAAKIYNHR